MTDKGQAGELLATLYLRLNGYFTSGFIVHSPQKGKNRTEVDVLGVRFPRNAEPEREVTAANELDPSKSLIDVVIAEVKSKGGELNFNEPLRTSMASLASVLRWVGLWEEDEIGDLAQKLVVVLAPANLSDEKPPSVEGPRGTRIRGLLFCPERPSRRAEEPWFLTGEQVFSHLWNCLRPAKHRSDCATRYNFGLWGQGLEPIVRFFKSKKGAGPGDFNELLDSLRHG